MELNKNDKYCVVPYCEGIKYQGVSFHPFPVSQKSKELWLKILCLNTYAPQYHICSEHFEEEDFYCYADPAYRKLKRNAVPSRNLSSISSMTMNKSDMKLAESKSRPKKRDQEEVEKSLHNGNINNPKVKRTSLYASTSSESRTFTLSNYVETNTVFDNLPQLPCDFVIKNDETLNMFTGIKSFNLLELLELRVATFIQNPLEIAALSIKHRLMLTFMILKNIMSFEMLSFFFNISPKLAEMYFGLTIIALRRGLTGVVYWPTKQEILSTMPLNFESYSNTRVVLYYIEIPVEIPTCLICKYSIFPENERSFVVQYLLGITPSGMVSFISRGYCGLLSHKQVFIESGLFFKIDPNDHIMIEQEFLTEVERSVNMVLQENLFLGFKCYVVMFKSTARFYVNNTIDKLKKFQILGGPVPSRLIYYMNDIVEVLSGIINLHPSFVG